MQGNLLLALKKVEELASASKLRRLVHNPFKYAKAIIFKEVIYPRTKKEIIQHATLFYGKKMLIALPAATDIYLTGGKSHHSETRLAKWMILNLKEGDNYLDVGAHYGYFTLLAAMLVKEKGAVYAFEASKRNFYLLKKNCEEQTLATIHFFNEAILDKNEQVTFYEFPNLYSEYNSINVSQFDKENWYKKYNPSKVVVEGRTIDAIAAQGFRPDVIKIDVEGAEYQVLKGAEGYMQSNSPKVVMEYLCEKRGNEEHKKAVTLLTGLYYRPHFIKNDGTLIQVDITEIDRHLEKENMESDNLVFVKEI